MRPIAFYLPQFHPIPENDAFWGEGFTEWTNVKAAKPLFEDHEQPRIPHDDIGYYDLLNPDTMKWQEETASQYGLHGFAYWHYWFGNGKTVLEKPLAYKLENEDLKLPFCLAWANESWTGKWHGLENEVILEQKYPGIEDYKAHFKYLVPFFEDSRYIRIDGKPVFIVHKPFELPNEEELVATFRQEADNAGLPGIFLLESRWQNDFRPELYDGAIHIGQFADLDRRKTLYKRVVEKVGSIDPSIPTIDDYNRFVRIQNKRSLAKHEFPVAFPNWDNTPRSKGQGRVLMSSDPNIFRDHLRKMYGKIRRRPKEEQLMFIKSWNEWAEGNYLEPDTVFHYLYLQKIRLLMDSISSR